jgi:hypothetical protein
MSVQRFSAYHSGDLHKIGLWDDPEGYWVTYADHARIVAEAGAAVFAFHPEWTVTGMCDSDCLACRRLTELITERSAGYEEGKADAEQAHAAALAGRNAETPIRGEHDPLCFPAIRDVRMGDWGPSCFTCQVIGMARAAAPRTLTSDCLHLAEMYVGQSSRDNEYGRRSPVIECLACGALRLDDETVPPNRLAGGDFDTSGQPRTLTADDPGYHSQRCLHCDHIRATHTLTAHGCIGHALPGRPGADCPCAEFIHDGEATPQVKPCSTCGEPVAYLTARPGWAGGWLHHPARPLDGHPVVIDEEAT